jgi:hypothetical protein
MVAGLCRISHFGAKYALALLSLSGRRTCPSPTGRIDCETVSPHLCLTPVLPKPDYPHHDMTASTHTNSASSPGRQAIFRWRPNRLHTGDYFVCLEKRGLSKGRAEEDL